MMMMMKCSLCLHCKHLTKTLWLRFEKFELEANPQCVYDSVSVYDGELINSSALIGRYCGHVIPDDVTSNDSSAVVNFRTDGSLSYGGFSAFYFSVYG